MNAPIRRLGLVAAATGLETANGIVVDARLRTVDPDIYAIGDCAAFPCVHAGGRSGSNPCRMPPTRPGMWPR